jgi:alkyl hydroperoxide reductase subunit AhpC
MIEEDDRFDEFDPVTPACVSVGDTVPNFSGETTAAHVENYHDAILKSQRWQLIMFVPKCLDPVSTSSMAQLAELEDEFKHREIDVYALVSDTKMSIRMWMSEISELCECRFNYP